MECRCWLSYEYHVTEAGGDGDQPSRRQPSHGREQQRPVPHLIQKVFLFQPASGQGRPP